MSDIDLSDKTSYAPFLLADNGQYRSLLLSDGMEAKTAIFTERNEGWLGNGYDWNSIAQVVVADQLADLEGQLSFDPEADMFCAIGSRPALERLGLAMRLAYHNDAILRDLLSRAELD